MIRSEGDCQVVCNHCYAEVHAVSLTAAVTTAEEAGWFISTVASVDLCPPCQGAPSAMPGVLAALEAVG
jgi:hypothetical protein